MGLLAEGKKAPAFALKDKDGQIIRLSDLEDDYIVLYFYPKDNTPGCTLEAQGFNRDFVKYKKLNALVLGISGGDEKSKQSFCSKYKLKILLLSDSDFTIAQKYGVFGPKKFMGKTYQGINRTTFVLDKKRQITKVFEKVDPATHSKEVLDYLNSLSA